MSALHNLASPSSSEAQSEPDAVISRLKRQLAAKQGELDEATGNRAKKAL